MGATTVRPSLGFGADFSYMCTATNGKYSTDVLYFSHRQITCQTDIAFRWTFLKRWCEKLKLKIHLVITLKSYRGT